MGHQIIKQPDGKLCVFSTIVDRIILADCTPEDLLDYYAERAAKQARKDTQRALDAVLAGNPREAYAQRTMTYDKAVKKHREYGGEERMIYGGPEW